MDFSNISVAVAENGVVTLNVTKADGSVVAFLDPAGVQAVVAEAVAQVPVAPAVTPEAQEVDLILTDGSTQKFVKAVA